MHAPMVLDRSSEEQLPTFIEHQSGHGQEMLDAMVMV